MNNISDKPMEMKKCFICRGKRTNDHIRVCDKCQSRMVDEMLEWGGDLL